MDQQAMQEKTEAKHKKEKKKLMKRGFLLSQEEREKKLATRPSPQPTETTKKLEKEEEKEKEKEKEQDTKFEEEEEEELPPGVCKALGVVITIGMQPGATEKDLPEGVLEGLKKQYEGCEIRVRQAGEY